MKETSSGPEGSETSDQAEIKGDNDVPRDNPSNSDLGNQDTDTDAVRGHSLELDGDPPPPPPEGAVEHQAEAPGSSAASLDDPYLEAGSDGAPDPDAIHDGARPASPAESADHSPERSVEDLDDTRKTEPPSAEPHGDVSADPSEPGQDKSLEVQEGTDDTEKGYSPRSPTDLTTNSDDAGRATPEVSENDQKLPRSEVAQEAIPQPEDGVDSASSDRGSERAGQGETPEGTTTPGDGDGSHVPAAPTAEGHTSEHSEGADSHDPTEAERPTWEQVKDLLPRDDTGYQLKPRDAQFVGLQPEQVGWWANREAPLGMTPERFKEFKSGLYAALKADGIPPDAVDKRLQGSSANFFSGEHKQLASEEDDDVRESPQAQQGLQEWFQGDSERPLRRPFDSHYKLGLDDEPSDYDIQLSSDDMVDKCRDHWDPDTQRDFIHPKYGFVDKDSFEDAFPNLTQWAESETKRGERKVAPALFTSEGPPNRLPRVSAHFRETDWKL
jgi:hypothetical protein